MEYTKLSLVLTDKCNAACDFCSLSCGPNGRNVMDEKLMLQVIHQAKSLAVKNVEFTGGEPFLYPRLLIEGARAAREKKLGVVVTTNGFWGSWDNKKILNMLKALQPDHVNVSTDFFHDKFVPVEHVIRVIRACMHLDIGYRMLVADMEGPNSAGRYLQYLGKQHMFSIDTCAYPARRCGRALNLPETYFLPADRAENTLSVYFDGNVYSCDSNEAREPDMNLGNALLTPLREICGTSGESAGQNGKEPESNV